MVKIRNKKKIALVLSGGGIKAAAFHIGVCVALKQKGFKFVGGTHEQVEQSPDLLDPQAIKTYVGSSAGALVSAFLASGHSIEDIIESFEMGPGFIKRPRKRSKLRSLTYFDIFSLNHPSMSTISDILLKRNKSLISGGIETILKNNFKVNGFFTSNGIEKYLRKHILPTNSFSELGIEFFAVATFLNHSRKAIFGNFQNRIQGPETHYINHATISDAVAASVSLPPVFAPYNIKGVTGEDVFYFDGEIRDTLSTHVASDSGADLVIASYSIQPYHYTEKVGSLSRHGLPLILNQALYQVVEQKIMSNIRAREDIKQLINSVTGYFKENNLPIEHAEKLVAIMCKKVKHRRGVDYIHIHPQPEDYEMFFVDHFSLNPEILARIAKIGFKSAIKILRRYDI
jgi:predicted acylesterase/phospholipase RssA